MDKSVYTFFKFNEDTEVGEVSNLRGVLAANGIFNLDGFPWVVLQLLDAKRHLALVSVECKDNSLYLVANVHEVLCTS